MDYQGSIIIDGLNVTDLWRIYLSDGAYAALLGFPPAKEPDITDWPEYDGVEADLSAPRLSSRELTLSLCSASAAQIEAFVSFLMVEPVRIWIFPDTGVSFRFRFLSLASLRHMGGMSVFSVKVEEDLPFRPQAAGFPASRLSPCGVRMDGQDLSSDMGFSLLQGARDNLRTVWEAKSPLIRSFKDEDGQSVLSSPSMKRKSRDVTLPLLSSGEDLQTFLLRREALLRFITRPGERTILDGSTGRSLAAYYKTASVTRLGLMPDASVWCGFSLTFGITRYI